MTFIENFFKAGAPESMMRLCVFLVIITVLGILIGQYLQGKSPDFIAGGSVIGVALGFKWGQQATEVKNKIPKEEHTQEDSN